MAQLAQRTVALVGFDSIQQSALSTILQGQGYAVVAFASADEAVAAPDSALPDVFLSGLSAPDVDGWRLCRRVRSSDRPGLRDVPILLLSATLTGEEAARTTVELGGDGLLPFPVDAGRLADSIQGLLSGRPAAGPARDRAFEAATERYRLLFSSMLDGCALKEAIFDGEGRLADFRFLMVNPAFERMTGLSAAAILGKTMLEVQPGTEKRWIESYGRVALTGEASRFEQYHAGLGRHFEVVAFRSEARNIVCIFKDITEYKEREKRARRLASLNELLTQANQAISRATSREELLESICRSATQRAGFRLTWIGFLDEATGEIRQCAQDTDEQGFPYPIRASECAVNRRAIKEGKPVVCNVMSPSQSDADCHLRAMDADIASCAAFPIRLRGNARGTLCVHSAEEGFFQEAEVERLEELARDMSLALDALDAEAERQRMVAALQESEATFRGLCDGALDAIVTIDGDGRVTLWNPSAERMFGYAAAEALGLPIHEIVAPAIEWRRGEANFPFFQKPGQGPLVGKVMEMTARRKDGSEIPIELSLAAVQKSGRWQAVAIVRDVTARREASRQVEEANLRYHLLAEQGRTIIWEMDVDGLYTYVSPVSETVWGYRPEELAGKKRYYDIAPEEGREAFRAAAAEVFARKGQFHGLEKQVRAKDGRSVWASSTGMPVFDERGEFRGYRGSSTDITERKQAEEEKRLSELRYRSLFENMLDAVAYCKMMYDEQGRPVDFLILEANGAFAKLTGSGDVSGQLVSVAIPKFREQCADLLKTYGRVASTGVSERFETYSMPFSQWRSVSVYSPEKGYFVAVLDDITERKQHEADRETMLALLRMMNASSDTRELICAITGRLHEWSGCETVGIGVWDGGEFPRYETRGFPPEFVRSDDYPCARDANREMPGEGQGEPATQCRCCEALTGRFDPHMPCYTAGGSFWTNSASRLRAATVEDERQARGHCRCEGPGFESLALIPLRSSGQTLGLLQFNDSRPDRFSRERIAMMERIAGSLAIALEQRNTQEALRTSEQRYRLISENTVDMIWMLHLESRRFTYVSPTVRRLLGYSPEEFSTKDVADVLTPESYRYATSRLTERLAAFEAGDKSARTEVAQLDQVRKDGSVVKTEVAVTLLPGRPGHPAELLGVTRDITERVQAETRLMLAQKMESVGRLAGGVAHDFNNLLTVINGYSHLLLRSMKGGDPLKESLEEIYKAGKRAAGLTQQLLAFSRKQVLKPQVLDLNHAISEMRPMLARLVGEDVDLFVELHPKAATVRADPHQLEQVVMNLAVNSRDAMPNGGELSIATAVVRWDENQARTVPGGRAGAFVVLTASDTGAGMSEETRQHIFEPFFTTKEFGAGTGLGLPMIQGIVEQSGGFIEVVSEPGCGTVFRIYLPKVEDAAADSSKPEDVPAEGGRETVLVVEDQADVRKYAAAALGAYGYQVIQAENAGEALLLCEREGERIHLVLTDVVMPNLSGRELANRLAKRCPGIKVLFMSGYTDDAIVHHGVLEQGTEFIQKPFSPSQLALKVREMLAAAHHKARILIADDEAGVRSFLRAALEDGGYEAIEAADGEQALKEVRAGQVDLVLMDLVMPQQEGIETIRILRHEMPGIGIIAISGAFGGQYLDIARLLGAQAVLTKPVSADTLLAKVAEVLQSLR